MKPRKASAVAVAAVLLFISPVLFLMKPDTSHSADLVSCQQNGNAIVCTAAGAVVLTVPIPTVRVPGPTIEVPGPTIQVPVPGDTVTVVLPGDTETVRVPGPTVTVPGDTQTQTVTETVTINPEPSELPTQTVTVTAEPSGQTTPSGGTVEPTPEQDEPEATTRTVVKRIGQSLLVTSILAALGFIALLLGYKWGFTDGGNNQLANERKWIRNLLDRK